MSKFTHAKKPPYCDGKNKGTCLKSFAILIVMVAFQAL